VLVYRALFGSGEWGKIGNLAQSALAHPNQTVREHGMFLVEAMDELPMDHEEDIFPVNIPPESRIRKYPPKSDFLCIIVGVSYSVVDATATAGVAKEHTKIDEFLDVT